MGKYRISPAIKQDLITRRDVTVLEKIKDEYESDIGGFRKYISDLISVIVCVGGNKISEDLIAHFSTSRAPEY